MQSFLLPPGGMDTFYVDESAGDGVFVIVSVRVPLLRPEEDGRLGMERYSGPGRVWRRMPSAWKDYAAGVAARLLPQDTAEAPQ